MHALHLNVGHGGTRKKELQFGDRARPFFCCVRQKETINAPGMRSGEQIKGYLHVGVYRDTEVLYHIKTIIWHLIKLYFIRIFENYLAIINRK